MFAPLRVFLTVFNQLYHYKTLPVGLQSLKAISCLIKSKESLLPVQSTGETSVFLLNTEAIKKTQCF